MPTSFDPNEHTMVGIRPAGLDAKQFLEHLEELYKAIDELDRHGQQRRHVVAFILVLDQGSQQLDAHWRKRFAEQRSAMKSPKVYTSVVTDSPVLRGALTAMNWVSPLPPNVQSEHHPVFEEGAAWVERMRGERLPSLRRLYATARARCQKTSR